MALVAYDPSQGGTVPVEKARVIAYVIDTDTGIRYPTLAAAQAAQAAKPAPTPVAKQASETAFAEKQSFASTPAATTNTLAGSLAALQSGIAESKKTVQEKNIEIPTIALEQAVNTGDIKAVQAAATELGKAQGLTGGDLRTFAYNEAQTAAKGEKPTPPPADNQYIYDYVWRQDVGGPGGKWVLVKTQNPNPKSSSATPFDSGGLIPKENNGAPLVGTEWTENGWLVANYADGSKKYIYVDPSKAKKKPDLKSETDKAALEEAALSKKERAENAISVLTSLFTKYGLASLVPRIKELAISGASEATITLQLSQSPEYKMRFKANEERLKKNLAVLEPGEYIALEDRYRQILRAYGLKQFDNDDYVTQFLANDVSPEELSSRVVTAVQRVQNADPAITKTLRDFYGIGSNDLVAYVLDPNQQLQKIERQVAAAEIGAAAGIQGLSTGVAVAEQLAAQGITKAQAQKGYATIADILPEATKLSGIYTDVLDQYNQAEAEQEVFNSLASAQRKRQRLIAREAAAFSGESGLGKSSLTRQIGGTI